MCIVYLLCTHDPHSYQWRKHFCAKECIHRLALSAGMKGETVPDRDALGVPMSKDTLLGKNDSG